jgi:hypothetical protein
LVWIFGSPRTGSTWLLRLLTFPLRLTVERPSGSLMPDKAPVRPFAVPINEPYLPHHLTPTLNRFAEPGAANFVLNPWRTSDPNYFFADAFESSWRPAVRHLILARLHAQAQLAADQHSLGRPLVVVKEPNGSHGAEMVMSTLPRSRMIFQLRDGRDVVDSLLHAQADGGWLAGMAKLDSEAHRLDFLRDHSRLWVNRMMAVQRAYDAHSPDLRLIVRYEDLRSDTLATLRGIVDWLGVERTDRDLEAAAAALAFESYPAEAKGPGKALRAASPGLWRENMSKTEREIVNETMGETIRRLGYEL